MKMFKFVFRKNGLINQIIKSYILVGIVLLGYSLFVYHPLIFTGIAVWALIVLIAAKCCGMNGDNNG